MLGSHYLRPSAVEIAINLVVALSFAATGLIAWARRPENNTGRLLLAVELHVVLSVCSEPQTTPSSRRSGFASQSLVLAVFVHLVLAYPTGRLPTKRRPR